MGGPKVAFPGLDFCAEDSEVHGQAGEKEETREERHGAGACERVVWEARGTCLKGEGRGGRREDWSWENVFYGALRGFEWSVRVPLSS